MNLELPADLLAQIRALQSTGNYESEADVLREALAALDERNADFAAIQAGLDDLAQGRTVSLDEAAAEVRARRGRNA